MKYRYFYQTKTNENREGWISAKNRAEAYAALRKQGIRPYRVVGDDPVRWQPWAIAALVITLMAGLVVALMAGRTHKREVAVRRGQLTGDRAVISEGLASGWTNVLPTKLDCYLAAYAQPGWIAMPPLVTPEEIEDFARELAAGDAPVASTDDPVVDQLKAMVRTLRQEMRDYLANGGSVHDYLAFLESRQDEEASFRNQAIDSLKRTPEPLRERARMNMNLRLRERGLLEIDE